MQMIAAIIIVITIPVELQNFPLYPSEQEQVLLSTLAPFTQGGLQMAI